VELESGGPGEVQDSLTHPLTHSPTYSLTHLQSQLAIVNTTSKPWVITRRITVGHSRTHSVEHVFFDTVHQRIWLFAVGIGQRSEHLLSVDPETNTFLKIELYSLLPHSSQGRVH